VSRRWEYCWEYFWKVLFTRELAIMAKIIQGSTRTK
jgi:hypothetical protein